MRQSCQISRIFLLKLPYLSDLYHQKFIAIHSDASFLLPTSLFSCFPYLFIHKLSLLLTMKAPSFTPSSVSSSLSLYRAVHSFNSSSLQLEMVFLFSFDIFTTKFLLLPFTMFQIMFFFPLYASFKQIFVLLHFFCVLDLFYSAPIQLLLFLTYSSSPTIFLQFDLLLFFNNFCLDFLLDSKFSVACVFPFLNLGLKFSSFFLLLLVC